VDPESVARGRMEASGAEAPRVSAEGASRVERRRREYRGVEGKWNVGRGLPTLTIFFDF